MPPYPTTPPPGTVPGFPLHLERAAWLRTAVGLLAIAEKNLLAGRRGEYHACRTALFGALELAATATPLPPPHQRDPALGETYFAEDNHSQGPWIEELTTAAGNTISITGDHPLSPDLLESLQVAGFREIFLRYHGAWRPADLWRVLPSSLVATKTTTTTTTATNQPTNQPNDRMTTPKKTAPKPARSTTTVTTVTTTATTATTGAAATPGRPPLPDLRIVVGGPYPDETNPAGPPDYDVWIEHYDAEDPNVRPENNSAITHATEAGAMELARQLQMLLGSRVTILRETGNTGELPVAHS